MPSTDSPEDRERQRQWVLCSVVIQLPTRHGFIPFWVVGPSEGLVDSIYDTTESGETPTHNRYKVINEGTAPEHVSRRTNRKAL